MALKTITFNYTGDVQTITLPDNVLQMYIEAYGARGMSFGPGYGYGGKAYGTYKFKNIDSRTLYIYVGATGWNSGNSYGGGASDIRINGTDYLNRIIVAGGGGSSSGWESGGHGGGLNGNNGYGVACGGGGTQTSGGFAGPSYGYGVGYAGGFGIGAYGNWSYGGGGWYGGGSGGGKYCDDGGGGGGSSYIKLLESDAGTVTGIQNGNGSITITYEIDGNIYFLENNNKYYFPDKENFDTETEKFIPVTISDIVTIKNNTTIYDRANYNMLSIKRSFIADNGKTYKPSDILDFTQCKLCIFTSDNLYKTNITYIPSSIALSKSIIKVKNKYTPLSENALNAYMEVTSNDNTEISYSINYDLKDDVLNKSCYLIDSEILKEDYYLSFKFTNPSNLLKAVTLYGNDSVMYNKINDDNLGINNDFINTFVTFDKAYNKVLINKITKSDFKYYSCGLDTF